jgi:hypothetical protein
MMPAACLPLVKRTFLLLTSLLVLGGCASTGASLQPGVATAADVERSMGRPAERRQLANGETVLWYPNFPWGKVSYAARIASDGRLIGVEQRMTEQNIATIELNRTTMAQVRDLLGPPYLTTEFPRMQREVWTYPVFSRPQHKELYVQFSRDGVVRESYLVMDPEELKNSGPGKD